MSSDFFVTYLPDRSGQTGQGMIWISTLTHGSRPDIDYGKCVDLSFKNF